MLKPHDLTAIDIEQIILLAWADTIPFDTIKLEYDLTESQVRTLMRKHQSPKTYARWRTRVETRGGRHAATSLITSNKMKFG